MRLDPRGSKEEEANRAISPVGFAAFNLVVIVERADRESVAVIIHPFFEVGREQDSTRIQPKYSKPIEWQRRRDWLFSQAVCVRYFILYGRMAVRFLIP